MNYNSGGYPPQGPAQGYQQQSYPPQNYPPQQSGYPPQQPQQSPYQPYPPQPQQDYKPQDVKQNYGSQAPINNQNGRLEQNSPYKDVWASLLFAAHFAAFIVLSYFGIATVASGGLGSGNTNSTNSSTSQSQSSNNTSIPLTSSARSGLITALCVGAFGAALLSAGYVALMKSSGRALIKVSIIAYVAMNALFVVVAFLANAWILAVINVVFLLITCLFFWFARKRIPLAAEIMSTVVSINSRYPASYGIALLSLIVQLIYSVYWSVTTSGVASRFQDSGVQYIAVLFCVFSGYWVAQVLTNTLFVTISGTVASYYFLEGTQMMPKNPTLLSAKRAFTTSFGAICFGSLIIAVIQTIRYMLRSAAQQNSAIAAIADCIIGCIQGLIEYFNEYAYVHVAVYGKSFCDAAKDTWTLIKSHGFDAIINDNLTGTVLFFGKLMVGLVAATLSYAVGYFWIRGLVDWNNGSLAFGYLILISVLVFLMGFMMMSIICMVIEAGVQTTFVCLAEAPEALARTKPELYEKFKQVYPRIQWQV